MGRSLSSLSVLPSHWVEGTFPPPTDRYEATPVQTQAFVKAILLIRV